jgi:16S rRNA processing protein RimM
MRDSANEEARAEGGEPQASSVPPIPLPALLHKGGGGASREARERERSPDETSDRVLVGEIGAAQGLNGEVRLRSYTQEPTDIAAYGPLQDEAGARTFEIESVRATPKALIARIKGVTTREAAEALNRTKLYLPRARLPAREEDEWYVADLIGLDAVDRQGASVGKIVAVHNFGAGDIIEVAPASGEANLLVSFTETTVPEIDIEGGRIVLVLPEELEE